MLQFGIACEFVDGDCLWALLVYFVFGMFYVFIVWWIFVFDCYFGIRLILRLRI